MPVIQLPVTAFVKKHVEHDYQSEIIHVKAHDYLYSLLCINAPSQHKENSRLNTCIDVSISSKITNRILKNGSTLGWHLHRCYRDRMYGIIYDLRTQAGFDAMPLIQDYLNAHHITEDDYAMETAYKGWQRYVNKKTTIKVCKNNDGYVLNFAQNKKLKIRPTKHKVLSCIYILYNVNLKNILGTRIPAKYVFARQLACFLLYRIARLKLVQIAALLNMSFSGVRQSSKKIENYIEVYPESNLIYMLYEISEFLKYDVLNWRSSSRYF